MLPRGDVWWLAGHPLKPQGCTSLGGVRATDVWGIKGRCTGAPGGVEEAEPEPPLFGVVGLPPVDFGWRPASGWERGSLDTAWEEEELGRVEEAIGSVEVDKSLSEDLELWWWSSEEEEERVGRVLLL